MVLMLLLGTSRAPVAVVEVPLAFRYLQAETLSFWCALWIASCSQVDFLDHHHAIEDDIEFPFFQAKVHSRADMQIADSSVAPPPCVCLCLFG